MNATELMEKSRALLAKVPDAARVGVDRELLVGVCDALAAAEKRADEAEARERGAVNARIETSHDLHIRLELAEAGAAAMREALVAMKAARDSAIAKRHNEGVALHLEFWSRMVQRNALAADAGAALLARLHAAESEVQRLRKDWDNALHAATSTMRSELRAALQELALLRSQGAAATTQANESPAHVQLLVTRDITDQERETLRKLLAEYQAKPGPISIIPLDHLVGLTVEALQRESYETAKEKGWHDEDDQPPSEAMCRIAAEGLYQAARCKFIEAYRKGERGDDVLAGVDPMGTVSTLSDRQVRVIAWLALINTEVAEAIEDVVAARWETTRNEKGKPEGLGSELADIIIRACDDAGALGIDLAAELRAKLDYNRTRSHKHGGKLA